MLRKESRYVHTVGVRLGNERMWKRGRGSHGPQSTAPAGVPPGSSLPPRGPLSLGRGRGETHQMDPQETKRANKGSFLFDFKIPATEEEASALSWCPSFAPSAQGDVLGGLSPQAPWSRPQPCLQPQSGSPVPHPPQASLAVPRSDADPLNPDREGEINSILKAKWGYQGTRLDPQQPASLRRCPMPSARPPTGPWSRWLAAPSPHQHSHKSLGLQGCHLGLLCQQDAERKTPAENEGHF